MSAQAPTPTQIRDAWDAIADRFDRHTTPHTIAFGEEVTRRLPLGPGVRVLDVGAGSGGLSIPAAREGAEVVAVDIAPTMVARLTARARAEGLTNLDARVGDGTRLDLEEDGFDVAMSLNGVSLFPDLARGLAELIRVTRPGGEIAVVTFGPLPRVEFIAFFLGALRAVTHTAVPATDRPLPPFRLAQPGALRAALEAAGLRDISVEDATWEMPFDDGDHLFDVLLSSNPIAGQLIAPLAPSEKEELRVVLDRLLRERSDGSPGALLRAEMLLGRGIV